MREQMQVELIRLQRQVGITFVLVTHDQEEALVMSDRIAVMFEGEIAQGLGGLMRASTAVAASARFAGAPAKIALRIVLTGAWGKDAPAAAERLAAAVHVVSESAFGRLLGIDRPLLAPQVRTMEDALVVEVTIDGMALARGLHDALDAEISEIMRR